MADASEYIGIAIGAKKTIRTINDLSPEIREYPIIKRMYCLLELTREHARKKFQEHYRKENIDF